MVTEAQLAKQLTRWERNLLSGLLLVQGAILGAFVAFSSAGRALPCRVTTPAPQPATSSNKSHRPR